MSRRSTKSAAPAAPRHGSARTTRGFAQVDVFTTAPTRGNPVAVVLDAAGLSDDQMAAFARWTNLSETTFLLPPTPQGADAGADYRLRIFTPTGELPFAGHPTLGSCHAWLEAGGTPRSPGASPDVVVQECGVGLVTIRRDDDARLAFAAPALLTDAPIDDAELAAIVAALGVPDDVALDHRVLDNGPGWRVVLLDSAARVSGLAPDFGELRRDHPDLSVGVVGLYPTAGATDGTDGSDGSDGSADAAAAGPDGAAVEVRGFALSMGIPEDPVTGSLNAVVGQWLTADGRLPDRYVAAQGAALGRAGRIHVERDAAGTVWVGGSSVTVVAGTVDL